MRSVSVRCDPFRNLYELRYPVDLYGRVHQDEYRYIMSSCKDKTSFVYISKIMCLILFVLFIAVVPTHVLLTHKVNRDLYRDMGTPEIIFRLFFANGFLNFLVMIAVIPLCCFNMGQTYLRHFLAEMNDEFRSRGVEFKLDEGYLIIQYQENDLPPTNPSQNYGTY